MARYRESWRFILGFLLFTGVVHGLGLLLPIPSNSWWWTAEPWLLLALFLTLLFRREVRARRGSHPPAA
jgi:membrane protein implicated in regulation of membrane protease activity